MLLPLIDLTFPMQSVTKSPRGSQTSAESIQWSVGRLVTYSRLDWRSLVHDVRATRDACIQAREGH